MYSFGGETICLHMLLMFMKPANSTYFRISLVSTETRAEKNRMLSQANVYTYALVKTSLPAFKCHVQLEKKTQVWLSVF